ncbi:MAG: tetratricopeptide repeat protein [Candidatus Solibacter sp.]|nr:tetratricopeptide repeat protein [Candidatus Solibacter sp.]
MPQGLKQKLTPEAARQVLAGEMPLSVLFGVSKGQLAEMASLGHQLWKQGRRQEAQKIFRGLIALDEKTYYGHAGMGLVAMSQEDLATAEQYLNKAFELEPSDASVAVNLGEVLLRQGKLEPAISALESASKLDLSGSNPGAARARAILTGIGGGAAEMRGKPVTSR